MLSIGTDGNIGGAGSTINFNGGILQVTGTAITNLDSHTVNWGSFNGGIDVNNAANTLTISEAIGGSGGLIKAGPGMLVLGGNNTYTGTTLVNAGTLRLGAGTAIPTGGNVTVASGAIFDIQGFSNSQDSPIGTLTLLGGTFRVPTGSGDYYLNALAMSGGTVDFTGTSKFWLHLTGTSPGISTSASTATAVWTGGDRSRIQNDGSSPLTVSVAAGTTPSGIDLDAGIEISNGGNSPAFIKAGAGVMRLTNSNNSASFTVAAGKLRVDDPGLRPLGRGMLTLDGGTLLYGNTLTSGSTCLPIAITSNGGSIETGSTLTLGGVLSGNGGLTKAGAGTLILSAANTYTGGTTISAGAISLNNANALQNSTVTVSTNNSLLFNSNSGAITTFNVGGLAGGGNISLADGGFDVTLSAGGNGASTTYSGAQRRGRPAQGRQRRPRPFRREHPGRRVRTGRHARRYRRANHEPLLRHRSRHGALVQRRDLGTWRRDLQQRRHDQLRGGDSHFQRDSRFGGAGAGDVSARDRLAAAGVVAFNNLAWTGGNINTFCNLAIPSGGNLAITANGQGFYVVAYSAMLANSGVATLSGTGAICASIGSYDWGQAVIYNASGGVFDIQSDAGFSLGKRRRGR